MAKSKQQEVRNSQPQLTISNKLKLRIDDLYVFEPLTSTQQRFFELYKKNKQIIMLHGIAGTGKTFIALYRALEEVMDRSTTYEKVVIVRSAVPSREIGHLPGNLEEKTEIYTQPYSEICNRLFGRHDAYTRLEEQNVIKFLTTSFIRGTTLDDAVIIVDEVQNMTDMEIHTIMTRVGSRSKIIFCGDFRQTDLQKKSECSGLHKFLNILKLMKDATVLEFGVNDIVRSELVKEYILARMHYEDNEDANSRHNLKRAA